MDSDRSHSFMPNDRIFISRNIKSMSTVLSTSPTSIAEEGASNNSKCKSTGSKPLRSSNRSTVIDLLSILGRCPAHNLVELFNEVR